MRVIADLCGCAAGHGEQGEPHERLVQERWRTGSLAPITPVGF